MYACEEYWQHEGDAEPDSVACLEGWELVNGLSCAGVEYLDIVESGYKTTTEY